MLTHNATARVIRSNQSLVLQRVTKQSAGNYSCSAINGEGETVSNQLELRVKCKFSSWLIENIACYRSRNEIFLSCHVLFGIVRLCVRVCVFAPPKAFIGFDRY